MNHVPGEFETPVQETAPRILRTFEYYIDLFQETVSIIRAPRLAVLDPLTYTDKSTGYSLNTAGEFVGFGLGLFISEDVVIPCGAPVALSRYFKDPY